jgi:hypothetical protein
MMMGECTSTMYAQKNATPYMIYATQAKTENYGKSLVFGSSKNAFFGGTGHPVSERT